MPSQTRELLKGAVPLLVLAVLASGDGYGYQITARIETLTDGAVGLVWSRFAAAVESVLATTD